ncbi:MAG: hypothetical protein KF823_07125 [Xanthomonadales bacterium]|nr:hypothetical protein [Xanthomonadales bacterium]
MMVSKLGTFAIVLGFSALVACSRQAPEPERAPEPAPASEPAPATPVEEAAAVPEPEETPAEEIPAGTDQVTGFHGFGPARFGDDQESVRISWGRPLVADREVSPDDSCHYLVPDPAPSDGSRVVFMLEQGRFVRYDVTGDLYEAPGGGRNGNLREALEVLYAGRHSLAPHKYAEGGEYFIVEGPEGSGSRLVFELDAAGVATQWRIGLSPQVDYVEGCG